MAGKIKYYVILHLIVLIWGFTGILGDYIQLTADLIVFFRTGIAFLSLLLVIFFIRGQKKLKPKKVVLLLFIGAIVGFHWLTFFYAIKISTVSIAVVCMSSSALFTALIEPLLFKRKLHPGEIILSLLMIVGIMVIFGFETTYTLGIVSGLVCAFLAALFTVLNGKYITSISSLKITLYEMLGACLTLAIILASTGKLNQATFKLDQSDWIYLLILGIICTSVAFLISVWVMKYVTPFTVSMSVNMEPVYTIIILFIIASYTGSEKEQMSWGFYLGSAIILASIFGNAMIKRKKKRNQSNASQTEILDTQY